MGFYIYRSKKTHNQLYNKLLYGFKTYLIKKIRIFDYVIYSLYLGFYFPKKKVNSNINKHLL